MCFFYYHGARYRGGNTGSSSQILLWKLECSALVTAEDVQQTMNIEQKFVGELVFKHHTAFRTEPFTGDELNQMEQVLKAAAGALSQVVRHHPAPVTSASVGAAGGGGTASGGGGASMGGGGVSLPPAPKASASIFDPFLADAVFLREKVYAQQLCDAVRGFHGTSAASDPTSGSASAPSSSTPPSPKAAIMQRFRGRPELASYRAAVEANLEAFVGEPLTVP